RNLRDRLLLDPVRLVRDVVRVGVVLLVGLGVLPDGDAPILLRRGGGRRRLLRRLGLRLLRLRGLGRGLLGLRLLLGLFLLGQLALFGRRLLVRRRLLRGLERIGVDEVDFDRLVLALQPRAHAIR